MLTPDYLLHCTDSLTELLDAYDNAVVSDIARRIVKTGYVTETAKHQIRQAQQMGLLYEDIIREIAQRTNATDSMVRALFEDAGVETVQTDNRLYTAAGLQPTDLRASPAMLQMLQAGYENTLGTMHNLTLTTANTAQQAYISACDLAMLQVQSGAMSYQQAIRAAIQSAASDGARVLYPSGRTDRIEVAVRRAVLTGVAKTCRTIGEYNAASCGCDLMELSAHAGARPSHAKWQGQLVSLSGKRGYLSKDDIGYGSGDGFGGYNCRHDWYPFFPGISQRNYSQEKLNQLETMTVNYNGQEIPYYDATQEQRRLERRVRELTARHLAGEPVAYLIGEWEFYGLPLDISPAVLIPRPDTEVLATKLIDAARGAGACRILDLCAGSGCIGLAAAANLPNARVLLGEYDEEALKICRQNIRRNRLTSRVASLKLDAREKPSRTLGEFRFLVSNPPYIPSADIETLDASVREHEPRLALDGGEDGLDFYRVICEKWRDVLCENGMLFFEVGIGQADSVLRIMRSSGFGDIQIVKDLNNIPRVVYGTRVEAI